MTDILYSLPLKGIVKSHYHFKSLEQTIYERIIHIPELDKLKTSIQLTELVCACIENMVDKNNSKQGKDAIDKKALCLSIMQKLFNLSPSESNVIGQNIDYLIDSKVIQRLSRRSRIWFYISRFFCGTTHGKPLTPSPDSR